MDIDNKGYDFLKDNLASGDGDLYHQFLPDRFDWHPDMWKPGTDRPKDTTATVVDDDKTSTIIDQDDGAPIKGKDLPSHLTKKTPSKFVLSQKTMAMKVRLLTGALTIATVQ